jgi:methylated-DNA-[protein]-cysteine S-methyltransferase
MHLRLDRYQSPLCPLLLVTDSDGVLRALDFADHQLRMRRLLRSYYGKYELEYGDSPKSVMQALDDYFDGELRAVDRIPVATGGTLFQRAVWNALRAIEPGATKSYQQIAVELDRAKASRAVGAANGANPVAIVVPCHRVIGGNGKLTGYAGGLPRKQWLLDHERRNSINHAADNPESVRKSA